MEAVYRYFDGNPVKENSDASDNKILQGTHSASGDNRERPCHHPGAPFYPVMLWMFPPGKESGEKNQ